LSQEVAGLGGEERMSPTEMKGHQKRDNAENKKARHF